MAAPIRKRSSLDLDKLTYAKTPLSTGEALRDVIAPRWCQDVAEGARKAILTHPKKET